jgi:hypothetical protein
MIVSGRPIWLDRGVSVRRSWSRDLDSSGGADHRLVHGYAAARHDMPLAFKEDLHPPGDTNRLKEPGSRTTAGRSYHERHRRSHPRRAPAASDMPQLRRRSGARVRERGRRARAPARKVIAQESTSISVNPGSILTRPTEVLPLERTWCGDRRRASIPPSRPADL